jgi:hypothetical protein
MSTLTRRLGLALVAFMLVVFPWAALAQESPPATPPSRGPTVQGPADAGLPPAVGSSVVEDSLTGPGLLQAYTCPSKRNTADFASDGLAFKITGKCSDTSNTAYLSEHMSRIVLRDGEVRFEMRTVGSAGRSIVRLYFRARPTTEEGYYAVEIRPGAGAAALYRSAPGQFTTLAERGDLGGLLGDDQWKSVAVRTQGPKIWVLINDQVVLSAVDTSHDVGDLIVGVARLGDVNEQDPTTVVLRNFRVARLAEGDDARATVFLMPPALTETVLEQPLTASGVLQSGECETGRNRTAFGADGFLLSVTGKCREMNSYPGISAPLQGVTLPDGEVRLEVRFGARPERAYFRIYIRDQPGSAGGYSANLTTTGADLYRYSSSPTGTYLIGRSDLAWLVAPTDWTSVAVRVRGADLWLLVNEQPVLYAWDPAYAQGNVQIELDRLGDPNDQQEVSATVRNLRISKVAAPP